MEMKCQYANECGGCSKININYEEELKEKKAYIERLFKETHYNKPIDIIGAKSEFYYRNKVQMAFKLSKSKHVVSGIYEEGTHHIIPVNNCLIQAEAINDVLIKINQALSKNKIMPELNGGVIRHVLVRYGFNSKEIMVVMVTSSENFPGRANFVKDLLKLEPNITTIVQNIQSRDTSIVLGTKERVLYGKGYINDTLCGLTFKISPRSFYQINSLQTEVLYKKALEYADLKKTDVVIDAYSGIGTIGMSASKYAKEVVCVENNPDAVKDAKINAKVNNINNVTFYLNDSTEFLNDLVIANPKIDCLIMDPPRTGSTKEFIEAIKKLKIKKVIYVSCGPDTLVRDLKIFEKLGYVIQKVCAVDMFPRTMHVETVCQLSLKEIKI